MRSFAPAVLLLLAAVAVDAYLVVPTTTTMNMKMKMETHQRTAASTTRTTGTNRRAALFQTSGGTIALGFALTGLMRPASPAQAFPFGGGDDVSGGLDEVAKARQKVEEVVLGLKNKQLKGGKDDSATIIRYSDSIYKPLQVRMVELAPKIKLADEEQQKRLETVPLLLKGHLLELTAAARSGDAKEQLQEMEEVAESVDEFLALAKSKYPDVKSYLKTGKEDEFDIVKEYGPFACEFWGKVRLPDSNICVWPDELEKK